MTSREETKRGANVGYVFLEIISEAAVMEDSEIKGVEL